MNQINPQTKQLISFFDADEYVRIVRSHATRGKTSYDVLVRRAARRRGAAQEHRRRARELLRPAPPAPCSGFVEVIAPVFTRELRRGPACVTWCRTTSCSARLGPWTSTSGGAWRIQRTSTRRSENTQKTTSTAVLVNKETFLYERLTGPT